LILATIPDDTFRTIATRGVRDLDPAARILKALSEARRAV
jgi:hypothetical protein